MRFFTGVLTASLLFGLSLPSDAAIIGVGAFTSPTIIDFNDAPDSSIGGFYSGLGVTFTNLCGGNNYNTGTGSGSSETASNFFCVAGFPDGEAQFAAAVTQVGFFITSNPGTTTLTAYNGATLVGFESFATAGVGLTGSFVGIEFASGFDRLVISTVAANSAFSMDDFRFGGTATPAPEPASLALLGVGLVTMGGHAWRRRRATR